MLRYTECVYRCSLFDQQSEFVFFFYHRTVGIASIVTGTSYVSTRKV